jgi:hypothetical protein
VPFSVSASFLRAFLLSGASSSAFW